MRFCIGEVGGEVWRLVSRFLDFLARNPLRMEPEPTNVIALGRRGLPPRAARWGGAVVLTAVRVRVLLHSTWYLIFGRIQVRYLELLCQVAESLAGCIWIFYLQPKYILASTW